MFSSRFLIWILGFCIPAFAFAAVPKVLFLGDSLTSGFRLKPEAAYPELVKNLLQKDGVQIEVVNGGVSGDTTTGGLRRLQWMLRSKPDLVVIAFGGNDMLRGLNPDIPYRNVLEMVRRVQKEKIPVVLFGMKALPNLGKEYEKKFNAIFRRVAEETKVPLLPFFLENVFEKKNLKLPDGIHPNEAGHEAIARDVAAFLKPEILKLNARVEKPTR